MTQDPISISLYGRGDNSHGKRPHALLVWPIAFIYLLFIIFITIGILIDNGNRNGNRNNDNLKENFKTHTNKNVAFLTIPMSLLFLFGAPSIITHFIRTSERSYNSYLKVWLSYISMCLITCAVGFIFYTMSKKITVMIISAFISFVLCAVFFYTNIKLFTEMFKTTIFKKKPNEYEVARLVIGLNANGKIDTTSPIAIIVAPKQKMNKETKIIFQHENLKPGTLELQTANMDFLWPMIDEELKNQLVSKKELNNELNSKEQFNEELTNKLNDKEELILKGHIMYAQEDETFEMSLDRLYSDFAGLYSLTVKIQVPSALETDTSLNLPSDNTTGKSNETEVPSNETEVPSSGVIEREKETDTSLKTEPLLTVTE